MHVSAAVQSITHSGDRILLIVQGIKILVSLSKIYDILLLVWILNNIEAVYGMMR